MTSGDSTFTTVDNSVVFDKELTPYAGWLYVILASHRVGSPGIVKVSLGQLMRESNMTRPTVKKHLQALEDAGVIEIRFERPKYSGDAHEPWYNFVLYG